MKIWTKDEILAAGYEIENVLIKKTDLQFNDWCCLVCDCYIDGSKWFSAFGGRYKLGHGFETFKYKDLKGSAKGIEYIMALMATVEVSRLSELKGKPARIASSDKGVRFIGNFIKDKWLDETSFFEDEQTDAYGLTK